MISDRESLPAKASYRSTEKGISDSQNSLSHIGYKDCLTTLVLSPIIITGAVGYMASYIAYDTIKRIFNSKD
jgi:hypothetical protein